MARQPKFATCHPHLKAAAFGLCNSCYNTRKFEEANRSYSPPAAEAPAEMVWPEAHPAWRTALWRISLPIAACELTREWIRNAICWLETHGLARYENGYWIATPEGLATSDLDAM